MTKAKSTLLKINLNLGRYFLRLSIRRILTENGRLTRIKQALNLLDPLPGEGRKRDRDGEGQKRRESEDKKDHSR